MSSRNGCLMVSLREITAVSVNGAVLVDDGFAEFGDVDTAIWPGVTELGEAKSKARSYR